MKPTRHRTLRLLALLAAASLLLIAAERAVALAERLARLPEWMRWTLAGFLLASVAVLGTLGWRWLRPRPRRAPPPVDRTHIASRLDALDELGADTTPLQSELAELDRRRALGRAWIAVFGEVSSGKSSLIAAMTGRDELARDVLGGTTREVRHVESELADGQQVTWADVPGSAEVSGEARETMAREEALRAHLVVYVTAGDLGRNQGEELRWLAGFGKPLLLVLNKVDRYSDAERLALLARLRAIGKGVADEVVAVSSGGAATMQRRGADGTTETVTQPRAADVETLRRAIAHSLAGDTAQLEDARERAVLGGLDTRVATLETEARAAAGDRIIARYSRRAIVGALAAVVPASDLVIQGVLATALARELAKLYDARVSDLEIESFLKQARLTLRTSASIVLAVAGNALKAFPGLGTLGGGVLQAFAYALIFDSLGHALARSFAAHRALDSDAANAALRDLLADRNRARLAHLASLTRHALRHDEEDAAP